MHPPCFSTFTDAYRAVLRQLHTRAEYSTASRGNRSRECLNVAFTLTDPRRRTPYLKARTPNIVFNYAEVLWYLAGRDDLAMIGYYAPPPALALARRPPPHRHGVWSADLPLIRHRSAEPMGAGRRPAASRSRLEAHRHDRDAPG